MKIAIICMLFGTFLLVEGLVNMMTGLRAPARIVWWNFDGSIHSTMSVPIGTDPHVYASGIRKTNTELDRLEYHVIEGG